jgi:hypothetical protein
MITNLAKECIILKNSMLEKKYNKKENAILTPFESFAFSFLYFIYEKYISATCFLLFA